MKNVLVYTRSSSSSLGGGVGVVKELYKGIGVAAIGGIPAGALYFTSYHIIRQSMSSSSSIHGDYAVIDLTAGFIAEGISCMVWVPIDVCKEQLQTQKELGITNFKGSIDALRANSLSRLYKGYWATLASFGPFSALYFAFAQKYPECMKPFGNIDNNMNMSSDNTVINWGVIDDRNNNNDVQWLASPIITKHHFKGTMIGMTLCGWRVLQIIHAHPRIALLEMHLGDECDKMDKMHKNSLIEHTARLHSDVHKYRLRKDIAVNQTVVGMYDEEEDKILRRIALEVRVQGRRIADCLERG
ncbi:hypothetical protein FOZ62_022359 [Perkinsus olseni]|uniref:Uncharacterized protein n=1 Tax=Perkinsus olseni TaxID=32597 RepID=A0A7J6UH71_PEROL|nr:hypothetical protein FOZ62_022359 [Perkinsus olseni]